MKLTTSEIKFMNIIWNLQPVSSGVLVKLCLEQFNWKKSTTYTFLKRLQERGAVVNENSIVTTLVSKEDIQKEESLDIIDSLFDGSISKFVNAYISNYEVDAAEMEELRKIVGDSTKEKKFIRFEV